MNFNWNALFTAALLAGSAILGCSSEAPHDSAPAPSVGKNSAPAAARPRIVALGDSLTAGYGLTPDQAYPALLQKRLDAEGYDLEVINAGVPGDTTAGGVRRLDWVLDGDVRFLIVALGGNDGLRGLPVAEMKKNLAAIVERAKSRGITVLLAGMEAPPNQGEEYTSAFRQVFQELASENEVAFMPFLLIDVGGVRELNQPDGIHPNAEGAGVIADNLWDYLQPLLENETGP
jgi:acyl-CoA thioesterase-1